MTRPRKQPYDRLAEALESRQWSDSDLVLDEETSRLVRLVEALQEAAPTTIRPAARDAARERILAKVPAIPPALFQRSERIAPRAIRSRMSLAAAVFLVIVLLMAFAGSGVAFAAQDSLPGDSLYPVKEKIEDIQLAVAGDSVKTDLYAQFLDQRITEIDQLVQGGRFKDIAAAAQRFQAQQDAAVSLTEKLKPVDLVNASNLPVLEAIQKHNAVLTGLLDQVPPEAQEAIQHAIQSSSKNQKRLEVIFGDGIPGNKPEDNPGNKPVDNPGNKPIENPGNKPVENPGNKPTKTPGQGKP